MNTGCRRNFSHRLRTVWQNKKTTHCMHGSVIHVL